MAFMEWLYFPLLLWIVSRSAGQDVFLERPESLSVELDSPARLNCTANDTVEDPVQWRRGEAAVMLSGRVAVEEGSLLLSAVTWSDIGEYTCIITFSGSVYFASATLDVTGYVKPFVDAVEGVSTFNHEVGEEQIIVCPIAGHPGPVSFHWQYSDTGTNVTSDSSVESGVFVNSQGALDLSKIETANTTVFVCEGRDVVGNSAGARIRVISTDSEEGEEDDEVDLLEWYFIVAYSVGGGLVLCGLTVVGVVCWLHCDQCCERVARKKPTRIRVRRSKVALDDIPVDAAHS